MISVPLGTLVYDDDTDELIGDMITGQNRLLVAKGGFHGLGNARFKSSTNRAPRKTTPGTDGEVRNLRLEMKVLADVGLLGQPNAGKSTFIRRVSAAKPKVADYPFTTLYPHLGVVDVDDGGFVIADIPGLISGAAQGAGLGIQFLKHLARTNLLLQVIDIGTSRDIDAISEQIEIIENELRSYDQDLYRRERWLVLNKIDLLADEVLVALRETIINSDRWDRPVHMISAVSGAGCRDLINSIQKWLAQQKRNGTLDVGCTNGR